MSRILGSTKLKIRYQIVIYMMQNTIVEFSNSHNSTNQNIFSEFAILKKYNKFIF